MPGNFELTTRRDAIDEIHILRLTGVLPEVMVVIAGEIDDVFIKERLAILWED